MDELKIRVGKTTEDGKFTLQATRCLGACGLAPVMMINDEVYGRLTPDEIPSILEKYKA
jgi:NADH-quinone oxidoreductase subunit E/NADP-reducing hydrogenase subunit HndA